MVSGVWEVDVELVDAWLQALSNDDYDKVLAALEVLEETGPGLGRPLVDTVTASSYKNMKELRPGSSGRSEFRILFAFDPRRRAILLVAGDKQGAWKTWYKKNIPIADSLYENHLKNLEEENRGK
jgi:hypothetical protein